MGSVFANPTPQKYHPYYRQKTYLQSRKTDRGHVVKHEQGVQLELCDWIRKTFPGVHFRSDTGSGAFNSKFEKNTHNQQQSARGLPDLTIFAMCRGYGALCIELKAEDAKLKRARDAKKMLTIKDSRGRIVERDYKLRKAGDWLNPHIERQAKRIEELKKAGYCAGFGVGLERSKQFICWYFEVPYAPPPENAELF